MKKHSENCPLIALAAATLALSILPCPAQTRDPQNPASHQSTGLAGRDTNLATSSAAYQKSNDLGEGRTAKDLMGKNVENKNGDKLGSVKDLVVDTRSGRVEFVIVSSGGVAGIGSHLKAVPPSALSTATTKKDTLALDVTQDAWKSAPDFDKKQLASLGDQAQKQQIYQYYKQQSPVVSAQTPTNILPPTGRESGQYNAGQAGNRLQLASDLIGKSVVNRQGQDVGKVSDLLVDISNPRATMAIIKPGSLITDADKQAGNQLFAIPVNSLNASGDGGKVVLDVTAQQFQQAQPFESTSWTMASAPTGTPRVFRYQASDNGSSSSSTDVDNTRRNARDRQPGAITPMKQSETREDLQLTANIRRAIVKDDSLSTAAKNVKVISANGKVVLRGPVHSEQEKNEIQKLAEQTAGAGNVENDLEVKQD